MFYWEMSVHYTLLRFMSEGMMEERIMKYGAKL